MNDKKINALVSEWDDVYKKGQLSLWLLLALSDGEKFAAEIADFMLEATNRFFEVKEQSLYRALRRFKAMDMVDVKEVDSPSGGAKRKIYYLTPTGKAVLGQFVDMHILPLTKPSLASLLIKAKQEGVHDDKEK
jgi:PadR family transcriptional regulator, regulatory protein PadR